MYTEVNGFNQVITYTKESLGKDQSVKVVPLGNDCYRIEMIPQGRY